MIRQLSNRFARLAGVKRALWPLALDGSSDRRTTEGLDARPSGWLQGASVRHSFGVMRGGWVYIVTNRPNGTLYIGVTSDLSRRIYEHRTGAMPGFTRRYGLKRLVWYEPYEDIRTAIQRESNMKHWSRAWKVRLILDMNPNWTDLYQELNR